jgi:hypothetical protein
VRRVAAFCGLALALAACAGSSKPPPPPPPPPPAPALPPRPVAIVPPRPSLPAAPISIIPPPKPDQCGAYLLGNLVGRPRTAIPVPVNPSRRRVVCSTCPRTEDFRPDRLTIEYDAATGKVTKVGCN